MAISLKHAFVSAKSDGSDDSLVRPSNWNEEHQITLEGGYLVGRATAGNGAAEEIACTAFGRSLIDDADAATARATLVVPKISAVDAAPSSPVANDLWFDTDSGGFYIYLNDGSTSQWAEIGGAGNDTSVYRIGGTDVALGDGGTGATLSDPGRDSFMFWDDSGSSVSWLTPTTGADRIPFYDDSASQMDLLTLGANLTISGTSIAADAYPLTLMTTVSAATGSPTSIDFTGIPSWAKRITIMFDGLSVNTASPPMIQIGDSGGIETTGYIGSGINLFNGGYPQLQTSTAGFPTNSNQAAGTLCGFITLTLMDPSTNTWVASGSQARNTGEVNVTAGSKSLSGTLDRVRITSVSGTANFDGGTINIMYE